MLVTVFWGAVLWVLYAYLLYPLILSLMSASKRAVRHVAPETWPHVSLVIAAHNEEAVLGEKLENSLALDYPPDRIQIIVASDGSTDATEAIAATTDHRQWGTKIPTAGSRAATAADAAPIRPAAPPLPPVIAPSAAGLS